MKIKNIKIYLVGFIFILFISILLNENITLINKQDKKDNLTFKSRLSISNSIKYNWYRTWGGVDVDDGWCVAIDSLDNVYLAGETMSYGAGDQDMVVVKYDKNGVQQWNRTWGGTNFDRCLAVAIDSSDNLYLAGFTYSFGAGNDDMVLLKYDENGVQQWNRTWSGNNDDIAYDLALDSSDNIYVVGKTESIGAGGEDMLLVNYNGNGVLQWNRTWGGADDDAGYGIALDFSDNIYISGKTESYGAGLRDFFLIKYDNVGILQWNRTWGGVLSDFSNGIAIDLNGNLYVVGNTLSYAQNPGSYDIALVKYDEKGVLRRYYTWGGDSWDLGQAVAIDSFGDVYIAGFTYSFGVGAYDMVLIKYREETSSKGISSYNLFIIIGILSISGLFLIKKEISKKFK